MADLYLDQLREYLFDEGRTVTYKWLSWTLDVHVNVAKQMLWHFLDSQLDDAGRVTATYLVAGTTTDAVTGADAIAVKLVRAESLESVKADMKSVLSVHVYSLSKGIIKDSSPILAANREVTDLQPTHRGVAAADGLRVLSDEEVAEKRNRAVTVLKNAPKVTPFGASNLVKKETSSKAEVAKSDNAGSKVQDTAKGASKTKTPATVASMFGNVKAASKVIKTETTEASFKTDEKPEDAGATVKSSTVKNKSAKTSSLGAMFAKQAAKPKNVSTKKTDDDFDQKQKEKSADKVEEKIEVKTEVERSDPSPSKPKTISKSDGEKRKHSAGDEEDDAASRKKNKRRRVRMMSDSSDEEPETVDEKVEVTMESEGSAEKKENKDPSSKESEDTPPTTLSQKHLLVSDDEDVIPATPPPIGAKKKRVKIRKLKDRTYMDDDGNFVTEKVMESEEEEVEEGEENGRMSQVKKMFEDKKEKAVAALREREEKERATRAIEDDDEGDGGEKKKKKSVPGSQRKKASPAIGKQTTLGAFFKKK